MYTSRPIITLLDTPAEILSLDLIKEFIGLDPDLDVTQDRALPVLIQAVIEDGEQITACALHGLAKAFSCRCLLFLQLLRSWARTSLAQMFRFPPMPTTWSLRR